MVGTMKTSRNEDNSLHFGRPMLRHWALEAGCTYLNHGTVGCPPRRALEAQQRIRDEIERQPSRFLLRELSPYLAGLAFMRELGLDAVFRYNHDLAWEAGQLLSECWGSTLGVPRDMIGTMLTIALPEAAGTGLEDVALLRDALLFEEQIEVQLHASDGRIHTRISAQVYNELADVQRLADAVLARCLR